ncbi:hypothetical protein [Streptomyces sp. NBC_01264]|uniref:hypothetical protein n=1 Tax=Streptomyces sp. NBC_01264 TaxID=2903804 RepID=UPI002253B159|nr:hypothetical protein [Streptomyces sp. NBC_01264]MCX4781477.1 hypothetical protein [Streptomyces sp. NBC_01264]
MEITLHVVIGHAGYTTNDYTHVAKSPPESLHLYARVGETMAGIAALKVLQDISRGHAHQGLEIFPKPMTGRTVDLARMGPVDEAFIVPNLSFSPLTEDEFGRVFDVLHDPDSAHRWLVMASEGEKLCTGACAFPDPHSCTGLLGRLSGPFHLLVCADLENANDARTNWNIAGMENTWSSPYSKEATRLRSLFVTDYLKALSEMHQKNAADASMLREFDVLRAYEKISWCFLEASGEQAMASLAALGRETLMARDIDGSAILSAVLLQHVDRLLSLSKFKELVAFMNASRTCPPVRAALLREAIGPGKAIGDDALTCLVDDYALSI